MLSPSLISGSALPRCLLVDDIDIIDKFSVSSVGRALVTLLAMNSADTWSRIMRYLSLSPGKRGENAIEEARVQLKHFLQTKDESFLREARALLPGCQTTHELEQLSDVLDCSHKYGDECISTCGSTEAAYVICSVFLCITLLIVLNLLLAVLMQSLQEHQEMRNKEREGARPKDREKSMPSNVSLLMSMSRAAAGWQQALKRKTDDDCDDEYQGPVFAGVSPLGQLGHSKIPCKDSAFHLIEDPSIGGSMEATSDRDRFGGQGTGPGSGPNTYTPLSPVAENATRDKGVESPLASDSPLTSPGGRTFFFSRRGRQESNAVHDAP
jgi:hypothetical protein